jgi:hypothetical protein
MILFATLSTWFTAHDHYVSAIATGFVLSLLWTMNIKQIAMGKWRERFIHAFGGVFGTASAFVLANLLR